MGSSLLYLFVCSPTLTLLFFPINQVFMYRSCRKNKVSNLLVQDSPIY